jgi:hypothetical protein
VPQLSLPAVDINPKYLDEQKCHHMNRAAAFNLFDRTRHVRDLPQKPLQSFDELIEKKLRPESYFEKKDRLAREEEKESSINTEYISQSQYTSL